MAESSSNESSPRRSWDGTQKHFQESSSGGSLLAEGSHDCNIATVKPKSAIDGCLLVRGVCRLLIMPPECEGK